MVPVLGVQLCGFLQDSTTPISISAVQLIAGFRVADVLDEQDVAAFFASRHHTAKLRDDGIRPPWQRIHFAQYWLLVFAASITVEVSVVEHGATNW